MNLDFKEFSKCCRKLIEYYIEIKIPDEELECVEFLLYNIKRKNFSETPKQEFNFKERSKRSLTRTLVPREQYTEKINDILKEMVIPKEDKEVIKFQSMLIENRLYECYVDGLGISYKGIFVYNGKNKSYLKDSKKENKEKKDGKSRKSNKALEYKGLF